MAKKPSIPCVACGALLWAGSTCRPDSERVCRPCARLAKAMCPIRPPKVKPTLERTKRPSNRERGYGSEHARTRREFVARHEAGDPCARCGEGMWEDVSLLDLDHTDDRTGYLGLSHRCCNRTYGKRSMPRGKPTQRAPRQCERCMVGYRPSYSGQRYCGRACAALAMREETARRNTERAALPKPTRPCAMCGQQTTRPTYCGEACSKASAREYMRNRYRRQVGIPLDAPLYQRAG